MRQRRIRLRGCGSRTPRAGVYAVIKRSVTGARPLSLTARARAVALALVLVSAGARAQNAPLVIGVLPFDASRADSAFRSLGFGIADLVSTDLAMVQRLRVVERLRLGDVLREQDLARGAAFDPSRAPRVGQLMRANRLVAGSLLAGQNRRLLFEARLVNVENGVIDTALRATADPVDILDAQKQITFGLLRRLRIELTPRERSVIEQVPTRNLAAVLAYGQGVEEEVNGNFIAARRSFRRAAALDPGFRVALARLRQSGAVALRTEGAAVQGVLSVLTPPLPNAPVQPPVGAVFQPGFLPKGTILVTISRP